MALSIHGCGGLPLFFELTDIICTWSEMIRVGLFIFASLVLLHVSGRALKNPGVHGFYRFFVFEGILVLVLVNHPYWFATPFAPLHIISWFLLALSIGFIVESLHMLKKYGGRCRRGEMPENFSFENTIHVVETGIYRYIRHPMYASLLFLGWGAFFKHITLLTSGLVLWITGFILAAARVEEKENRQFFGAAYTDYMRRTKMFIPWLK